MFKLRPFFAHVPLESKKAHLGLFLKVIFGTEEEKPTVDSVYNFMIMTHVCLFRDLGLNTAQFDLFFGTFMDTLSGCDVPSKIQAEIESIIAPLRAAFDYGYEVAKGEKQMSRENYRNAPTASANTMKSAATNLVKLPQRDQITSEMARQINGRPQDCPCLDLRTDESLHR